MIIYMEHPKHGRMPCSNRSEVEQAKVHGWSEVQDAPAPEPAAAEPVADDAPKRRGRPPKVKQ